MEYLPIPWHILISVSVSVFTLGYWLGLTVRRKFEERTDREQHQIRQEMRKTQYTGQKCADCQSPDCDIYPAVCDTCGATWPADMYLYGKPRIPLNRRTK